MNEPKLIVVYKAAGEVEAELVKGKLANAGIPAIFQYEAGAPMMGLIIDGWGEYRILVPEGWEREARAVLTRPSTPHIEP
jgi:Putative prokaryotic signal transducing protein